MTNSSDIHPFDRLAQHFAELVARHLNGAVAPARAASPAKAKPAKAAKAAAPAPSGRRRKGAKRPPELIEKTTAELLAYIKTHKGERIEQIGAGLGVSTKDLKLSAQKLLNEKKVKTKGVKRATKYFPA